MTKKNSYLVMGRQPWNRVDFDAVIAGTEGDWHFSSSSKELEEAVNANISYDFIFFLHWSQKVATRVLDKYECVCFHMTDVPYGRGGSPLQNLIARGHRLTSLTALRMTEQLDAGPVYMKRPLSLEGGTAEEIFARASRESCEMALEIANLRPQPQEQDGDVVMFNRRNPQQSELPVDSADLLSVFDHIRMLDAEGYPRAFLHVGNYKLEFARAGLYHDGIRADVKISLIDATEEVDR